MVLRNFCSRVFKINVETFTNDELKDKEFDRNIILDFHHIDKMREILINDYGYDVTNEDRDLLEHFEGEEFETPRQLLRIVGTHMLRDVIDDDIWIKLALQQVMDSNGKVVVTDARFPNERKLLRSCGALLVKIKRNDNGDTKEHEFDLGPDEEYDIVFTNDGTLNEFTSNIKLWYSLRKSELEYVNPIIYSEVDSRLRKEQ